MTQSSQTQNDLGHINFNISGQWSIPFCGGIPYIYREFMENKDSYNLYKSLSEFIGGSQLIFYLDKYNQVDIRPIVAHIIFDSMIKDTLLKFSKYRNIDYFESKHQRDRFVFGSDPNQTKSISQTDHFVFGSTESNKNDRPTPDFDPSLLDFDPSREGSKSGGLEGSKSRREKGW